MSVFMSIYLVLALIVAAVFAVGVLFVGISVCAAVYGCMCDNPKDRFVVGLDYGSHYLKCFERFVNATEKCVDVSVKATEAWLPEEESEETEEL